LAYLVNNRCPWTLWQSRGLLYEKVLHELFLRFDGNPALLRVVRGSTFQFEKEYMLELYQLTSLLTERVCEEAAWSNTIGDKCERPLLSSLLAPCMSILNEWHCHAHIRLASEGQCRRLKPLAEECIRVRPEHHHDHRVIRLWHPLLLTLADSGDETRYMMSVPPGSLEEDHHLSLLDANIPAPNGQLKKKLRRAFCEKGNVKKNAVLDIATEIILPFSGDKGLYIPRSTENGGPIVFHEAQQIVDAFFHKALHPGDLKTGVEIRLQELLNNLCPCQIYKKAIPPVEKKKGATQGKGNTGNPTGDDILSPNHLDIRIGRIVKAEKHPDANALYVEEVDFGEGKCRTVVSGLAGLVPLQQLQGALGVFLCNLKPAKMRGIESQAMLLCASCDNPRQVEPLSIQPRDDISSSIVGSRVVFPSTTPCIPEAVLNPKKKVWESIQSDLCVADDGRVVWKNEHFLSLADGSGTIVATNMRNVPVK
jgi:tyrosyl-tRNA synthetase